MKALIKAVCLISCIYISTSALGAEDGCSNHKLNNLHAVEFDRGSNGIALIVDNTANTFIPNDGSLDLTKGIVFDMPQGKARPYTGSSDITGGTIVFVKIGDQATVIFGGKIIPESCTDSI